MVTEAFILAGGLGTRLRSIVSDRPKSMATIQGKPLLEHLLNYLSTQGIEKFVICVGYLAPMIVGYFGDAYHGKRISYSLQPEPLGTGGALSKALQDFPPNNPFLVCNGDTFFPIDTSELLGALKEKAWAVATFRSQDSDRYGALTLGSNCEIIGFRKRDSTNEGEFSANSGIWIGNPAKICSPLSERAHPYSLEEYLSGSLQTRALAAVAVEFEAPFIDIGIPDDFARAKEMDVFGGRRG